MPEHIIIVEDDATELASATAGLREMGWPSVHSARSVADASHLVSTLVGPVILICDADTLRVAPNLLELVRVRHSSVIGGTTAFMTSVPSGVDRLLRKPYGDALQKAVVDEVSRLRLLEQMKFTVALLIADRDNPTPSGVLSNGSGCLLELPQRRIILTAAHVALALRRPGVVGLVGGQASQPINLSQWPTIALDVDVDIAAIEVPSDFAPAVLGKAFYRPPRWPPARARRGDPATFAGYAGIHRIPKADRLTLHATSMTDFVSSVSARQFILADEGLERTATTYKAGLEMFGPTGGLSGAPVFVSTEGSVAELRGVLHEGGDGPDATLFVAHSDFIRADGTFDADLAR